MGKIAVILALLLAAAGCAPRQPAQPAQPDRPPAPQPPNEDVIHAKMLEDLKADLERERAAREKLRETRQGVINEMEATAKDDHLSGDEKAVRLSPLLAKRADLENQIEAGDRRISETQRKVDALSTRERARQVIEALKRMEDSIALLRMEEKQREVESALKSIEQKMSKLTSVSIQEMKERVEQHRREVAGLLESMTEDVREAAKQAKSFDTLNALREMEQALVRLSRLAASDDFEEVWSDVILQIRLELEKYRKQ